jgi:hypothetical protein
MPAVTVCLLYTNVGKNTCGVGKNIFLLTLHVFLPTFVYNKYTSLHVFIVNTLDVGKKELANWAGLG